MRPCGKANLIDWLVPAAEQPRAPLLDFAGESPGEARRQAEAIVHDLCKRPFTPDEALLRYAVLRHPGNRVTMAALAHHSVFNGASRSLFMQTSRRRRR